MAITYFEAAKISRNPTNVAIFKEIVTEDQLFSILPMVGKDGDSFINWRQKTVPTASFADPNHTSIPESSPAWEPIVVPKREILDDVDVRYDVFLAHGQKHMNNAMLEKFRAVARTLSDKLINGAYATSVTFSPTIAQITASSVSALQDTRLFGQGVLEYSTTSGWRYRAPGDQDFGEWQTAPGAGSVTLPSDSPSRTITITTSANPAANLVSAVTIASTTHEFDGLRKLIGTPQVIAPTGGAAGDAISFPKLDQLLRKVKYTRDRVFLMRGEVIDKFLQLVRTSGGLEPRHIMLPSFGQGGSVEREVMSYRGVPILVNDWIGTDTQNGGASSSIYLTALGEQNGGIYCGVFSGSSEDVDADPYGRSVLGLGVIDVGILESVNVIRKRIYWHGALALSSTLGAARAEGIIH